MKRLIFVLLVAFGWLFINEPLKAAYILYFTSSPGSWVGQGQTLTLTSPTTAFSGYYTNEVGHMKVVSLKAGGIGGYELQLIGPNLTLPTVGFYPNATRWPFMGSGAGLAFSGDYRGDNELTAFFEKLGTLTVFDNNQG